MSLGNFYVWNKQFPAGQELLEQALEMTQSHKLKRIITTSLVDSWRRWAEDALTDKMPGSALEKGLSGVHTGKPVLVEGAYDYRLVDAVARSLLIAVRALKSLNPPSESQLQRVRAAVQFVAADARFRQIETWERLGRSIAQLPEGYIESSTGSASVFVGKRDRAATVSATSDSDDVGNLRRLGVVVNRRETFGFISHPEFPGNVFFHLGSLISPSEKDSIRVGVSVEFSHSKDADGRDRAEQVVLVP
jgi:cold shock CspA family protein